MKWHIGKAGVPTICRATVRDCPVGGVHFDSYEQAQSKAEEIMAKRYPPPSLTKVKVKEPKLTFKERSKNALSNGLDAAYGESPSRLRFWSVTGAVSVVLGAGVATAVTAPLAIGSNISHNHAENNYKNHVYSVRANVKDLTHSQFTGKVRTPELQDSNFKSCSDSPQHSGYVVCKTTDGKYTITAKPVKNHSKRETWLELTRVQVKDNTNGSVHKLSHKDGFLDGNDNRVNFYIPKN